MQKVYGVRGAEYVDIYGSYEGSIDLSVVGVGHVVGIYRTKATHGEVPASTQSLIKLGDE